MKKAEFEALIKDLEGELGLLKARYEQWIQGIERIPPARQKDRLERRLRELRREQPNNTAMRYRFQAVFARWTTMNTYWQRITRQIEEGTFRRDVQKAKRKKLKVQEQRESQPEGTEPPAFELDQPLELDLDVDFDSEIGAALAALEETPSAKKQAFGRPVPSVPAAAPPPAPPPVPPVPPPPPRSLPAPGSAVYPPPPPTPSDPRGRPVPLPPPPPPKQAPRQPEPSSRTVPTVSPRPLVPRQVPRTPAALRAAPQPGRFPPQAAQPGRAPPGLSERDLQHVYDKYVDAKRKNNERVDNLSREKLAQKIRAMEPKLRQKYGSANVDFEVVVKGGRVGLKPKKKQ